VLDSSLRITIGGETEKAKTDFVQFCGGYVFFITKVCLSIVWFLVRINK
jgi:hypothetical protein